MQDKPKKRATSLRTKLLTGFLFFCILNGFGMYLSLTSVQALRQFATTNSRIISLLNEMNTRGILIERIESRVDDLFIANYPEKRTALREDLDKLEWASRVVAVDARNLQMEPTTRISEVEAGLRTSLTALIAADFSAEGINALASDVYSSIKELRAAHDLLIVEIRDMSALIAEDREGVFSRLIIELMLMGLVVLLALIGLIFYSRSIIKPIITMSDTAKVIAGGQFEKRLEVSSDDEFGLLGRSFNQMTDTLVEAQRLPQSILYSMQDPLFVVDYDGVIKEVNRAAEEMLGYKKIELVGKPVSLIFKQE